MKAGLFLGAGASVPYDKPTTKEFKDLLKKERLDGITNDILQSILSIPEFDDVEHVLQAIKETNDFMTNWGGSYFRGLQNQDSLHLQFQRTNINFEEFAQHRQIIQTLIEDKIFDHYRWNHQKDHDLDKIMHCILEELMEDSERKIVFTTNYDRAVERYCEMKEFQILDGYTLKSALGMPVWDPSSFECEDEDKSPEGIDPLKPKVYLYKLHGSLSWKTHVKHKIVKINTEDKSSDPNFDKNHLIYPTLSPKDSQEFEPYKTIHKKFVKVLEELDVCIVIGFSFRDKHITDEFRKFIGRNTTLLVVFSPSAEENVAKDLLGIKDWSASGNEFEGMGERDQILCVNELLDQNTVDAITSALKTVLHEKYIH